MEMTLAVAQAAFWLLRILWLKKSEKVAGKKACVHICIHLQPSPLYRSYSSYSYGRGMEAGPFEDGQNS